ncbi:hypothetical protein Tco_0961643 [Tanacetum coccineum]
MGDENSNRPRTLGDYSRPSHEGYRNAIELPEGAKVSPLRSDTIRLVQNGCAFHRLMSEDPIQHLKDFLKIVDSIDLNGAIRKYPRLLYSAILFNACDEPIGDMEDKVDNPSPQSTPQVLPSFEVYTPPVTYPEEVEETIGIPMEVEPLDHMKLEDLGLNTNTHDLFLSFKGFPSVDEPEPQLLPNFSPLDVNLGDKRGTDPPINPYSPGSFRMKVVKPLTIHTPPSPHVAYLYRNVNFVENN